MKAAVVPGFGKRLAIEEVDVLRPGAHAVLVKIEPCGQGGGDCLHRQGGEHHKDVFARLHEGRIERRVVLDLAASSQVPPHLSAERAE